MIRRIRRLPFPAALVAVVLAASAGPASAAGKAELYNGKSLDEYCSGALKKEASALSDSDRRACRDRYSLESGDIGDLEAGEVALGASEREDRAPTAKEQERQAVQKEAKVDQQIEDLGLQDLDGPAEGTKEARGRGASEPPAAGAEPNAIEEDGPAGDDPGIGSEDLPEEAVEGGDEDLPVEGDDESLDGDGGAGDISLIEGDGVTSEKRGSGSREARRRDKTDKKRKGGSDLGDRLQDDGSDLD